MVCVENMVVKIIQWWKLFVQKEVLFGWVNGLNRFGLYVVDNKCREQHCITILHVYICLKLDILYGNDLDMFEKLMLFWKIFVWDHQVTTKINQPY